MKIKKILSCALAVMLSLGSITALPTKLGSNLDIAVAADAANDFVIKNDEDGEQYIAKYNGKGGDITLPKGFYVGAEAFKNNDTITSIIAPEDYYFGDNAFENCINLKSVTVKGNAAFGGLSFYNCINLENVTIEGSVDRGIGYGAFAFCQSLKSFTVKKNTIEFFIGQEAFACCYSLKSINIPSKCTEIYEGAFINCFNLEQITIPAKTKIDYKKGQIYPFGYFNAYKNSDDIFFGEPYYSLADGKTSVYYEYLNTTTGTVLENDLLLDAKKTTPKKLTMIVTKGSEAENYAKTYGVAYKYASTSSSSSSDKLSAPQNIKATKKTTSSITLSWDTVNDADAYTVYIYNESTGKYEKYKTVKNAKCSISDLKKGTSYKFKVAALDKVNGKYKTGNISKAISVKTNSK